MAHHTYKTRGFVLGAYGTGEEHLYAVLLTEELGLVRAVARSGRALRSRLRLHTQPLTFGEYSLVRGREVWRMTGARASFNARDELTNNTEIVTFLGRYTRLLRRLLAGEGEQPELFALVNDVLTFTRNERPAGELLENLEYITVLRTLLLLGYVGEHRAFNEMLRLSPITTEMLQSISPLRRSMASVIDRALRESHL